jgi:hypothetical protein
MLKEPVVFSHIPFSVGNSFVPCPLFLNRKMKRISIVLLFTFLLIQSLSAQRPNSFSYDPSRFIGEFEDFFKTFAKGDNKDAGD